MKVRYLIFILFPMILHGCIDPIAVNIKQKKKILVVEGFISTGPGPYRINLSNSEKFGDIFTGFIQPEEGAQVWVWDDKGNGIVLAEESPGSYETPINWRAEVGRSYTLNISTAEGGHFTSLPETVRSVAPIDSLLLQFKKIPTANPAVFITGVEVFARFRDPSETRDFYIWRNNGTFIIETRPDLFTVRNFLDPFHPIPAPKDCCILCWVNEFNADFSIKLLDDKNSNGTINTVLAAFIPDDRLRFQSKYMAVIQQFSISKDAHAFFSLLKKQLSIDGNIFDPPPATIRGNMINLDNPEENVIGYFQASDVSLDTIFIGHNLFSDDFRKDKVIKDDCRTILNSTVFRPDFWK